MVSGARTRAAAARLWALPTTTLGLVLLPFAVLGGGRVRRVGGIIEAQGGWLGRLLSHGLPVPGVFAFTLGHVVVARDRGSAERWRAHELAHVRQAERWGPLFLPAYAAASLWAFARGRHPYRDNPFEREAYAAAPAPSTPGSAATPTARGAPEPPQGGTPCAGPV